MEVIIDGVKYVPEKKEQTEYEENECKYEDECKESNSEPIFD